MDDTSQKFILIGIGLLVGAAIILAGLLFSFFPKDRIKRNWGISIFGLILGIALIVTGIVK